VPADATTYVGLENIVCTFAEEKGKEMQPTKAIVAIKETKEELIMHWESRYLDTWNVNGPSCAIVGSSTALLYSMLGKEIDQHDLIFRRTSISIDRHFAQHLGSKTTHFFLSEEDYLAKKVPYYPPRKNDRMKRPILIVRSKITDGDYRQSLEKSFDIQVKHYAWGTTYEEETYDSQLLIPIMLAHSLSVCGSAKIYGWGENIQEYLPVDWFTQEEPFLAKLAQSTVNGDEVNYHSRDMMLRYRSFCFIKAFVKSDILRHFLTLSPAINPADKGPDIYPGIRFTECLYGQ
jgi:hypothetical protein